MIRAETPSMASEYDHGRLDRFMYNGLVVTAIEELRVSPLRPPRASIPTRSPTLGRVARAGVGIRDGKFKQYLDV